MLVNYSIIIPHWNDLEGLERLIQSIPNRKDIEIIVVDDHSDKKPNDLPEHVKIYYNESEIQSAGLCRNIGMSKAIGQWLIFADSDDFFLPEAFNIIDNNIIIESDIIYFAPTSIYSDSGEVADRHHYFEELIKLFINSNDQSIRYDFVVPWSKVFNTKFIKNNNIKFDEVIASNDVMFSTKSGHLANNIYCVEDVFYCVTRSKGSLTTRLNYEVMNCRFKVGLNRNDYLCRNDLMKYQDSFLYILKKFRAFLKISDYSNLFILIFKRKLIVFPRTYWLYLKDLSALNKRLSKKKSKSEMDNKYISK